MTGRKKGRPRKTGSGYKVRGTPKPAQFDVRCPHCGRANDRHSDFKGGTPQQGDISLCILCGEPAVYDFTAPYDMRLPTPEELVEIEAEPDYKKFKAAWTSMQEEKKRK